MWRKNKTTEKKKPRILLGTVSAKQVLLFTKNLGILLKSGSTLSESIQVLRDQAKGKWYWILNDIVEHIEKGLRFSEALGHYPKTFPPLFKGVVEIGEQSGTLEENLSYLTIQLEKSYELKRKVFSALMYPAIVMIGMIILGFGVSIFILPKISRVFESFRVELPLATRILLAISRFFTNYGTIAIIGFFVGIFFLIYLFRRHFMKPLSHWLLLHIPVVKNLVIRLNLSMFCRTLGILLRTGTTIDDGLRTCVNTTSNFYYMKFLQYAHNQVKGGSALADILKRKKNLFPPTVTQIIQVGEASGTLSDSLDYCAQLNEDEVDNLTQNLTVILEPLILLVLGIAVATLALAIITPIYSITEQFRG